MQSKANVTTKLVERLDWRVARRDEHRIARRLWKKQAVDAISSLEEGAMLDALVHFLDDVGVLARWQAWQGEGMRREMVDFFPDVIADGRQQSASSWQIRWVYAPLHPRLTCKE